MELREGAVIAEKFRLIRLLGQGGMGEVWAAQHTSLDIPCAVKFIHAESAEKPEVRARFEREAKAAAQLRTNNVVQILDYGVFENTPYIAMEYLEGEPLSARIKRRGRLDPHETFRVVKDIARALTKAHAAGVVHRDLKPENVFLVVDDDREVAKVLDFGVAKSADKLDSNTQTGARLGTPYFMSPEQAQGTKTVDHRADLWSLAVLTFRCVTGELPFKSTALGDLLIKIVTHPIPVPSQVAAGVPEGFDGWWERAAQRDPNRRYQNAKEMVQALGMALNVSMPSTLGNTPMPGGPIGQEIRGAQQQIARTMVADPHELPQHAPYPHAAGYPTAPHAAQGYGYGQPGHPMPGQMGAAGITGPNPQLGGIGGNPLLGESHPSVAGVPLAARSSSNGGVKAVLITVVLLIGVAGGVGFWLMGRADSSDKPTEPAPASLPGDTSPTPAEASSTGSPAVEPAPDAQPPDAPDPQPPDAQPPDAQPPAPGAAPSPRIVPRPVPVPVPVPVPQVPVPAPPPVQPPPPRPVPDDDAGF